VFLLDVNVLAEESRPIPGSASELVLPLQVFPDKLLLIYVEPKHKANHLSNRFGVTTKVGREDQQNIQWNYYLNLLCARQRFATEVAISLAFATEVAISPTFADAPIYILLLCPFCLRAEGALKQSTRAMLAHQRSYPAP